MNELEQFDLVTSPFGYSGQGIDTLETASELTLATIIIDDSSSICFFKKELEAANKEIIKALRSSPRADNLMVREVKFSSSMEEVHGYKVLSECNETDYDKILGKGGMTCLFDACINAIEAHIHYSKQLTEDNYDVNGIVVILTDGEDTSSQEKESKVKEIIKQAMSSESMTNITTVLVGLNTNKRLDNLLKSFQTKAEIQQYIGVKDASAKTLAKVANFVSKSISNASQNLHGSGPSQPVSLSV